MVWNFCYLNLNSKEFYIVAFENSSLGLFKNDVNQHFFVNFCDQFSYKEQFFYRIFSSNLKNASKLLLLITFLLLINILFQQNFHIFFQTVPIHKKYIQSYPLPSPLFLSKTTARHVMWHCLQKLLSRWHYNKQKLKHKLRM